MIIVGLIGILISALSYFIAFPRPAPGDGKLFASCAALHILASVGYWQYAQINGADTILYYADAYRMAQLPTETGTIFVTQFVQVIKTRIGGSYLDYFILFQSFGMIGIACVIRSFGEVTADLGETLLPWMKALLFLPGLHFWTSAIGKDSALFLAVALSIWAMINIERRFPALILALVIMYPVRPHIAAISVIALIVTLTFDARTKLVLKIPLGAIAMAGAFFTLRTVQDTFRIENLDYGSITNFIADKQAYGMGTQAGAVLTELPFPLKIASLLFRPFFFDAGGADGLISSFENIVWLFMFGTFVVRAPTLFRLASKIVYVRYCLIFTITLIVLLSLITYNVGLGLRQKYMVMPAVLLLFVTLISYRRSAASVPEQGYLLDPTPNEQVTEATEVRLPSGTRIR